MHEFSKEQIEWLFERKKEATNIPRRRESTRVDFKENFWKRTRSLAGYARTMAAFANRSGGYIVFGVSDRPRELVGVTNNEWSEFDEATLSQRLGRWFAPTIDFMIYEHQVGERQFPIIYSSETNRKPIIALANYAQEFKEGDILYRYGAETTRIRPDDLQNIIEQRIARERRKWQEMLQRLTVLTPEKAGLLDLESGRLETHGRPLYIDEDLLDQIQFVQAEIADDTDEGRLLHVVGDLRDLHGAPIIIPRHIPTAITRADILEAFFSQRCDGPEEYLKQIVNGNTHLLPIWFFIHLTDKSADKIVQFLQALPSAQSHILTLIIDRLAEDRLAAFCGTQILSLDNTLDQVAPKELDRISNQLANNSDEIAHRSKVQVARTLLANTLAEGNITVLSREFLNAYPRRILEAITHVPRTAVRKYQRDILARLKSLWDQGIPDKYRTLFRKAICYVDIALYKDRD